MANHLSMALIDTIRTLHSRGWTQRGIARALNIHRSTVARYLDALDVQPKPANAPPGSEAASPAGQPAHSQANLASSPDPFVPPLIAKRAPGCPSACLAYRDFIVEKLEQDLSAKRIYQDLQAERAYSGSYFSVRRFVGCLLEATPLPFRRMECQAGEEAQVDFGLGAPILDAKGKRSRAYYSGMKVPHKCPSESAIFSLLFDQSKKS